MADAVALKDQANKAFAAKQYDEAIELYSQAIALDPKNHVLYSNRSAAKAGKKLWPDALADAEETVKLNPTWPKGFARKGAALHGARRYDEAIAAYEEGIKLEGDNPTAALKKGLKEVQDAKNAEMRPPPGVNPMSNLFSDPQLFSKLAANPKTAPWLADQSFVGKLKFAQSNPAMSQNILDDPRMITVLGVLMGVDMSGFAGDSPDVSFGGPGSPSSPGSRPPPTASSSKPAPPPPAPAPATTPAPDVKMAEPEEPEELDEEAQAKQDALKEKELGNAAYKKRDFVQAEAHFTKAWDLWPKDMTFLTNLAAVYFESGDYAKTIQTCEKAIDEGRGIRADYKLIAKALGRIGSAYAKLDDLDNAIKFFNKSLTEHRTPDILNKLRDAEKEKKERDVKAYFNPELSAASREEGNKLFKSGKFAESVKEYTEAIARDPSDARGYNNRAAAYQKLAALPEALKDADKAIEVDPKFVKAYIRRSLVLTGMREYTKAMEAAQKASDVDEEKKHTAEIEGQMMKIQQALYDQRSGETEEQTYERAMRDPEVASILSDPVINQILQQAQSDPRALNDHMKNPMVRDKINKLVAAGIIKTR